MGKLTALCFRFTCYSAQPADHPHPHPQNWKIATFLMSTGPESTREAATPSPTRTKTKCWRPRALLNRYLPLRPQDREELWPNPGEKVV